MPMPATHESTRRAFLAASVAAAAGLVAAPAVLASSGGRSRSGSGLILGWEQHAEGVHAVCDLATGGNSTVLVSGGEALVVDTKFTFFGEAIRGDAQLLAESDGPVTLVNTHHHGDHTEGNLGFLPSEGGGVVLAHRNAVGRIRDQAEVFTERARGAAERAARVAPDNARLGEMARALADRADTLDQKHWTPTLGLGDEGTISIGDARIAYAHFGAGHTDNDLVLDIDSGRVVVTGDLVFNGIHPFFDASGGVTVHGWIESLARVYARCDKDTVVIPGHGPVGDRGAVSAQREYLERLVEAVRAEIDAGTSREDAVEKSWPFMDGVEVDQFRPRAIGAVYDELAG